MQNKVYCMGLFTNMILHDKTFKVLSPKSSFLSTSKILKMSLKDFFVFLKKKTTLPSGGQFLFMEIVRLVRNKAGFLSLCLWTRLEFILQHSFIHKLKKKKNSWIHWKNCGIHLSWIRPTTTRKSRTALINLIHHTKLKSLMCKDVYHIMSFREMSEKCKNVVTSISALRAEGWGEKRVFWVIEMSTEMPASCMIEVSRLCSFAKFQASQQQSILFFSAV